MKKKSVSVVRMQEILRVSWDSGNEFIDMSEVQEYRHMHEDCKLYTNEVRKSGQIVCYTPILRWLTDDRFTLEYDNPGKFESGRDADGDLGLATYSLQNQTWTCVWEYEEDGWPTVAPDCTLLDTSNETELELMLHASRNGRFVVLNLDKEKD
jgi:hypothetical protein